MLPALAQVVIAQTYPRCELLPVDDGSSDAAAPSPGATPSAIRTLGLRHARGDYLALLSSSFPVEKNSPAWPCSRLTTEPLFFSPTGNDKEQESKGEQEFHRFLVTPKAEVFAAGTAPHRDPVADDIEKVSW